MLYTASLDLIKLFKRKASVFGEMGPKIIFMTGPPVAGSLDWDSADLLDDFQPQIQRFLDPKSEAKSPLTISASPDHASWRFLPLKPRHLATGFSQVHGWNMKYRDAEFLSTQDLTFVSENSNGSQDTSQISSPHIAEEALSQFYEESFAIHEDVPSSALPIPSQQFTQTSQERSSDDMDSMTTSSGQSDSLTASMPPPMTPQPEVPYGGSLSDLEDIPNANYLNSIQPQTMTINMIVGIISISPPRFIKTRRGAGVEIVEILVGDETKAGFGINFWLHPNNPGPAEMVARRVLGSLRLQDIVLFKNVALASFRGKVFGQSLRKDMTKIHLLYRNLFGSHDLGGCYRLRDFTSGEHRPPQAEKTRIVREWVLRFVGGPQHDVTRTRKRNYSEVAKEVLPPDTQ